MGAWLMVTSQEMSTPNPTDRMQSGTSFPASVSLTCPEEAGGPLLLMF